MLCNAILLMGSNTTIRHGLLGIANSCSKFLRVEDTVVCMEMADLNSMLGAFREKSILGRDEISGCFADEQVCVTEA